MPIPFILGGIALAAAGYGVKKGVDAKEDYELAERINEEAKDIYDDALEKLDELRGQTNSNIEGLGELKLQIDKDTTLPEFIRVFEKIKNVDFEDKIDIGTELGDSASVLLNMKETVLDIKTALGGAAAAAGSGVAAGFGAFGSVGMLASASTGTAISGLSGAAATNATLAWLGGGALSAGGGGMALGTAVLGGFVAGPVIAVGGAIMAAKAEVAYHNARENRDKARAAAEEMDVACIALIGIDNRVIEFLKILGVMNENFKSYIDKLTKVVNIDDDYSKYTKEEKETVMTSFAIATTIKNICDAPIINEDGKVAKKSKEVLIQAEEMMTKIREV
jgi:hypothetical protein